MDEDGIGAWVVGRGRMRVGVIGGSFLSCCLGGREGAGQGWCRAGAWLEGHARGVYMGGQRLLVWGVIVL